MSVFSAFVKNEYKNNTKKEEKKKKKSPFQMVSAIHALINNINKEEIDEAYSEILEEFGTDINERYFVATLILKYSVYNKICLKNLEKNIITYKNIPADDFIKYFMKFCIENSVKWPPFLKYYNAGQMFIQTRYNKFFEDNGIEDNEIDILQSILKKYELSLKDLYYFVNEGKINVEDLK